MSGFFKIIEKTQAWKNSTDQKTHVDFDFVMPDELIKLEVIVPSHEFQNTLHLILAFLP